MNRSQVAVCDAMILCDTSHGAKPAIGRFDPDTRPFIGGFAGLLQAELAVGKVWRFAAR